MSLCGFCSNEYTRARGNLTVLASDFNVLSNDLKWYISLLFDIADSNSYRTFFDAQPNDTNRLAVECDVPRKDLHTWIEKAVWDLEYYAKNEGLLFEYRVVESVLFN